MMIFSIDTGNDKIKTEGNVTQAGLKKLDYIPEAMEEALYYNGEYYMETNVNNLNIILPTNHNILYF